MPFFGAPSISHVHGILPIYTPAGGIQISVGIDEVIAIGDLLERGQFTSRSIDENVIVISELLEMGRVTVRNLFESIHLPADESFMLRSFTTMSFTPVYSSGTFDTGTSFDSTSFFSSAPGGLLSGAFETPSFDSTSFEPFMGSISVGPVPQLSRMTKKFRSIAEPIVSIGGAPAIIGYIVKMLSETVVISELLAIEAAIQKALTETVTITDTLTRISTKSRSFISFESVSISDALARAKSRSLSLAQSVGISDALTRLMVKARAIAQSIGIGEAVAVSRFKHIEPTQPQIFSITDALTSIKFKARAITQTVTITDTLQMALENLREIIETVSISDLAQKAKIQTRALPTQTIAISDIVDLAKLRIRSIAQTVNITDLLQKVVLTTRDLLQTVTISDLAQKAKIVTRPFSESITISEVVARFRSKARSISQSLSITDQVERVKPTVRNLATEVVTILEALTRVSTATVRTWILSGKASDFPDRLDNLVMEYITSRWTLTNPAVSNSPLSMVGSYTPPSYTTVSFITPTTGAESMQFNNFDYDKFRSYYVKITEMPALIQNTRIRANLYTFEAPIEFECWARRLKKGEAFEQLNNIINELMRIIIQYQPDDIFGVQGITFDSITQLESPPNAKRDSATKTVWRRTLRVTLLYHKVNLLTSTA